MARLGRYFVEGQALHVIQRGSAACLPLKMQSLGRRYVGHVNRVYRRTSTLWEGRYRAAPIESGTHLLSCYRYVELNPVRARMVVAAGDYPWSSHRANANGVQDPLVTPHALYLEGHGVRPRFGGEGRGGLVRQGVSFLGAGCSLYVFVATWADFARRGKSWARRSHKRKHMTKVSLVLQSVGVSQSIGAAQIASALQSAGGLAGVIGAG